MSFLSWAYGLQYRTRARWMGTLRRMRGTDMPLPRHPHNVLFVVAGLIGDTIMCTPTLLQARKVWPEAKLTVLGRKHNCDLLEEMPALNGCILTSAVPFSLRKAAKLGELAAVLTDKKFDTAIILLGDQFAPMLEDVGVPVRVGVAGDPLAPFLTHTYEIGSPRAWGPDERLNALRTLGCEVTLVAPRLWCSGDCRDHAREVLERSGLKGTRYAVIHPFGSSARQHWPLTEIAQLAAELRSRQQLEPVLIGGPEQAVPERLNASIVNTVGRLTLRELMVVIQEADVVITTDSGPFHLAGALSRPVVGLFRKSRPEHAGRYDFSRVLLGNNSSCVGRCRWDWCAHTPCNSMAMIGTPDIMVQVRELLGRETR